PRDCVEAAGFYLPKRQVQGLAQVQEPAAPAVKRKAEEDWGHHRPPACPADRPQAHEGFMGAGSHRAAPVLPSPMRPRSLPPLTPNRTAQIRKRLKQTREADATAGGAGSSPDGSMPEERRKQVLMLPYR